MYYMKHEWLESKSIVLADAESIHTAKNTIETKSDTEKTGAHSTPAIVSAVLDSNLRRRYNQLTPKSFHFSFLS